MVASPPLWAVWTDVLWCLGLGLCLAAVRDAAGLLLGHSRPVQFALDLLAFAAAAVLACGFAAGLAAGGVVRWYMAAAMAAGALGWQAAVSGPLHRAAGLALRLLTLPMRLTERYLARPLAARLAALRQKNKRSAAKRKKHPKKNKKILQKQRRILYN